MRRPYVKSIRAALAAMVTGAALVACSNGPRDNGLIFATGTLSVTPDTISIPGCPALTASDIPQASIPAGFPALSSTSPLLDAAFADAMVRCDSLLTATSLSPGPVADFEIWQTLALLAPQRCIPLLMERTADSIAIPPHSLAADYGMWAVAAREVALATGSRSWMELADTVARRTYLYNERLLKLPGEHLLHGHVYFGKPIPNALPRWMDPSNRFECITTLGNSLAVGAARAIADMASALGAGDPAVWAAKGDAMANAININLWQPHLRRYGQYLYTGIFPIPSPIADNAAQALAILFGVPAGEMSDDIVSSTPFLNWGMPLYYPTLPGTRPITPAGADPGMQALWALAAARCSDAPAVSASLGFLLASSFSGNSSAVARRMVAMTVLRILAGIQLTDVAMTFRPVVPRVLREGFTISGLRYRNAVLSIKVSGFGNKIAKFTLDGVETTDYSIGATLAGSHSVEILLANNSLGDSPAAITHQVWAPAVPEIEWRNKFYGTITDPTPAVRYIEYVNSSVHSRIDSATVSIPRRNSFARVCVVPVSPQRVEGLSAKPADFYPPAFEKTLQAEDFADSGTTLVRDRRRSKRVVESSPAAATSVTFTITATESGPYSLSLCYSNGAGNSTDGAACGVRRVEVNGRYAGNFIMPGRGDGWWLATGMSNTLRCSLQRGENTITLRYIPELYPPRGSARTILYDYLTIIKLK